VSACAALAVLAVAVPAASAGVAFASVYTPAGTNTWTVVAVDRAGNSSGVSNAATLTVRVDTALC
jgi:hypothetical protein